MMKRAACVLMIFLLLTCKAEVLHAEEQPAARPNVLFIVVDDLKPTLGSYGDALAKTPRIDELAARGTAFTNAHCQQAVCAASRVSVMSGMRPDTTGVWGLHTKFRDALPATVTIPQHFKEQGYETVGMGKVMDPTTLSGEWNDQDAVSWSIPYQHPAVDADDTFGYLDPDLLPTLLERRAQAMAQGVKGHRKLRKIMFPDKRPPTDMADVKDNEYEDGALADRAVELIGDLSGKDKPFFLAVGFHRPHLPFNAPKRYWDLYNRDAFDLAQFQQMPKGAPGYHFQDSWEMRGGYNVPKGPFPQDLQRELIHGYYASVSYVDAQVGKLVDALREAGVADSTVIVLWGDHGWHLGDHGMWCKHTNYEQATRAPLIFYSPKLGKADNLSASPVEFVDIYPTLCELTGLPAPKGLQGVSLTPVMKDGGVTVKAVAISQYPRKLDGNHVMGYALRDSRYRYIEWRDSGEKQGPGTGEVIDRELYDYDIDPLETKNLIDDPGYADVVRRFEDLAGEMDIGGKPDQAESESPPTATLGAQNITGQPASEQAASPTVPFQENMRWRGPDERITYKTTPQGELALHVFKPKDWRATDSRPAVVFFHGGGWNSGDAKAFYWQSNYLASRGMVAISAEYRIKKVHGTMPPACVADGKSAIRYVRAHADELGIDPERIAASGGSAGGHVAASAAIVSGLDDPADTQGEVSSKPDALILFNPVLDATKSWYGRQKEVQVSAQDISPTHQLAGAAPPTIIFSGDADTITPIDRARAFNTKMARLNNRCELVVYPGRPHSFFYKGKNEGKDFVDTLDRADKFLQSLGYLKGPATIRGE